jgi:ribose 5-phosphate isomerase
VTSQTEVGMHAEQSLKPQAAGQVAADIQPHTIVGLGHVSTAMLEVRGLAEQLSCGELADIQRIPCSRVIEAKARRLDIPRITPEDYSVIDLTAEGIM